MNEYGVVLTYFKMLQLPDNKDKTLRAFFQYILDRKPVNSEFAMLSKITKDFGHDLVFDALLSTRYSDVDFSGNYWGYVIAVCKNLLKESVSKTNENDLAERTEKMLQDYKKK